MLKLQDFRAVYPEYNNLTDYELSTALHRTHYAGIPYERFARDFGGPLQEDKAETAARDYNAANPEHPITAQDIRDKDRSGIWGGIQLLGEGIYDAVTDQFPEDMARAWRGGDIDPANPGVADSIIRQQTKDSAARTPSLQEAEGDTLANSLYQGPKSVATGMATGIAGSLAGGAAGTAGGSVVPGIGTAAGRACWFHAWRRHHERRGLLSHGERSVRGRGAAGHAGQHGPHHDQRGSSRTEQGH